MYCSSCGSEVAADHRYCPQCGTAVRTDGKGNESTPGAPRLSRPLDQKKIAGVCAGIARYLNVDVTLIRILTAILTVYPPGLGLIFYIVCWIVMPRDAWVPPQTAVANNSVANATNV
ncbi:MAG: PspC domain-containing protein [Bryobacteraceae bacterium]